LAGTAITNTGATTLCGSLGISPGSSITYAAMAVTCGGVTDVGDSAAIAAQQALTVAYNYAAGLQNPTPVASELGGQTLNPGLYSVGAAGLTGTLTLNGAGVYIFEIASTLTAGASSQVVLVGGATPSNVFWGVGSSATLAGTSPFQGIVMAQTSITMDTGATLIGQALAMVSVTLDTNTITVP
jgi:hypothetical protein